MIKIQEAWGEISVPTTGEPSSWLSGGVVATAECGCRVHVRMKDDTLDAYMVETMCPACKVAEQAHLDGHYARNGLKFTSKGGDNRFDNLDRPAVPSDFDGYDAGNYGGTGFGGAD